MNDKYTSLFDKIQTTDEFKKDTVKKMLTVQREKEETKDSFQPKLRLVWRAAPAVALLVIAAIIGMILLPGGSHNNFTLVASAASVENAELNQNSFVPIFSGETQRYGTGIDYENRQLVCDSTLVLTAEGENIEKITYTVENGVLISQDAENDIAYTAGWVASENQPITYEVQTNDESQVQLVALKSYTKEEEKIVEEYSALMGAHDPVTAEEYLQVLDDYYNLAFSDVKLTTTVTYTDGSTESESVIFSVDVILQSVVEYDSELSSNNALADIVLMAKLV